MANGGTYRSNETGDQLPNPLLIADSDRLLITDY